MVDMGILGGDKCMNKWKSKNDFVCVCAQDQSNWN